MSASGIAVVGMAGRFPGAPDIARFWHNLEQGVESIRALTDDQLLAAGVSPDELRNPDYVRAAAILDDVAMFDAAFFGFSPRDAAIMDPQHRHFLECAWSALEHAGYTPESFPGSIGVYAGSGLNAYMIFNLLKNRELVESAGLFLIRQTGNDKDVLSTRVSYQLNLRGPSVNVQTACSTSLVAIHMACQSLLNHECDMALSGGATIETPHATGYVYREGEILSKDGHCRSFDARSTGTVFGSGIGIVVLRRLEDALASGDTIHAIIRGSAINNDGARKVGYLAPSVDGQAEAIAEALAVAGLEAGDISYVETHGTGTRVGDPIEIAALTQAFRQSGSNRNYCAIGSVKSNIGHLDTAAGVAGFIKTVLALEHKKLPPSLHFETANPLIDFENSPFYVNTKFSDWEDRGSPRRAGVTSLGIGGTNAHVVLEEAPLIERKNTFQPWQLLPVSARTPTALEAASQNLSTYLREHPELMLPDVAFTLQTGRKAFPHRLALVARESPEAASTLAETGSSCLFLGEATASEPSVAFVFPGQGSQYVGMGRDLYDGEEIFRHHIDDCAARLRPHLGLDIRDILYPAGDAAAASQLNQTWLTQPTLFAVEYALAQLWAHYGIRPDAMVGHSIGEYVAACLAQVMSLDDALAVTAARGRLMQDLPAGAMLSVSLPELELRPWLAPELSVAALNGPGAAVISGPTAAIDELERTLGAREIPVRRLHTSHAFHSPMMEPILDAFTARMGQVELRPPQIPYLSNVTGTWITPEDATSPLYWAKHLRHTVRFADCVAELCRQPNRLLLEVGPGLGLASLVRQQGGRKAIASLRHPRDNRSDLRVLLEAAAQLWVSGKCVNWPRLHAGEQVRRVPLPTYPFERQRYWIEPSDGHPIPALRDPLDGWFQGRVWKPSTSPPATVSHSRWMIFADRKGLGREVIAKLQAKNCHVVSVSPGEVFARLAGNSYTIRPGMREDYDALLLDLAARDKTPQKILHLWAVKDVKTAWPMEQALDRCFYSPLFLAQAAGDRDLTGLDVAIVSNGLQRVNGEAVLDPVCATLLGPARVIPKELPGIHCGSIDIDAVPTNLARTAETLIAELSSSLPDLTIAYRGEKRWVEALEPLRLIADPANTRLRQRGVYLITGGLGGLGLAVADHLARTVKARLVLVGRSPLPPPENWEELLRTGAASGRVQSTIGKLQKIQKAGGEILVVCADVSQREDMRRTIALASERFGSLNGVIHAAGIIEDAPLQLKTRESARRVLDPKIAGTLLLHDLLSDAPLDFFVLFSSISSILPPAGQVDYAAANAFLDAFAASRNTPGVVAINWGLWTDIGMGAQAASFHPLLHRRLVDTSNEIVYSSQFTGNAHWFLDQHRFRNGKALAPGTAYLELAAAALTAGDFGQGIEIEDVFFLAPLIFEGDESKEIRVRLRRESGKFHFSVLARGTEWTEHASGQIARSQKASPVPCQPAELIRRCDVKILAFDSERRTRQEAYFDFGPRWRNLVRLHLGDRESVAVLQLPPEYAADLAEFPLHPALLDLATGAALYLLKDYDSSQHLYLPVSYRRISIYRPLSAKLYSHIRYRQDNTARQELVSFDITVYDSEGNAVADIQEFSLRRMADASVTEGESPRVRTPIGSSAGSAIEAGERRGISPQEGLQALERILQSDVPAGIVVFPEHLKAATVAPRRQAPTAVNAAALSDEVEATLAEWWRELLGVEQVGIDNDFFDLGGHSLVAVRLFSKIKKTYRLDFGLATLFEARTIRLLARLIRTAGTPSEVRPRQWSSLVPIQTEGGAPPLFLVSGLGGNVLNFQNLARYLGRDQPVYALQPQGLDGQRPFLTRVEDMAAYYIREIRTLQPNGPYRLAGYSFGGFVTFEMARQLRAKGEEAGLVALLDTIEWHYLERIKKTLRVHERLALYKSRLDRVLFSPDRFDYLKRKFLSKSSNIVYRFYKALGRTLPQAIGTIEDINSFAAANYKPSVYPGSLIIFRSVSRSRLEGDDELLGWGGLAAGGVEVYDVPGTHHDITREPGVQIVAETLRRCLNSSARSQSQAPAQEPKTESIQYINA